MNTELLINRKWGELSEKDRETLMKSATAVDAVDSEKYNKSGDCTIDLIYPLAVPGHVQNAGTDLEEIAIDDDAIIYSTL